MHNTAAKPYHARRSRAPLSFAQEQLWLMEKLRLAGSMYTSAIALGLDGSLDVTALDKSLDQLVIRHESLRTRILSVDGRGIQLIDAARSQRLERFDLGDPGVVPDRLDSVMRWIERETARPFDVKGGELLRTLLLHVNERAHVLLLCAHRMIWDEGSTPIALHELGELYRAYRENRAAALADLPMQYADYAFWQRELEEAGELERQTLYWRQQLSGLPSSFDLPTDRPRPFETSLPTARLDFCYSSQVFRELVGLSRRESTTVFMTVVAACQVLLMRWTGQRDLAIGIPATGRRRPELEGLIGLFVNRLVLRTQLAPQESFSTLLGRVKETVLAAYAHQDLPFERLVEEVWPTRDLSRRPVFRVWLDWRSESTPAPHLGFPGLTVEPISIEPIAAPCELALRLLHTKAGGLAGTFEYAMDLFDPATIEQLAQQFQRLLEAIVARPDTPIEQLPGSQPSHNEPVARSDEPCAQESQAAVTAAYVAPRTPVEEAVARIWSEVLRIPRVGVHDDFFELGGGHSLVAIQMIARLREVFAVDIPLTTLFQAPAVHELAACVSAALAENGQ